MWTCLPSCLSWDLRSHWYSQKWPRAQAPSWWPTPSISCLRPSESASPWFPCPCLSGIFGKWDFLNLPLQTLDELFNCGPVDPFLLNYTIQIDFRVVGFFCFGDQGLLCMLTGISFTFASKIRVLNCNLFCFISFVRAIHHRTYMHYLKWQQKNHK